MYLLPTYYLCTLTTLHVFNSLTHTVPTCAIHSNDTIHTIHSIRTLTISRFWNKLPSKEDCTHPLHWAQSLKDCLWRSDALVLRVTSWHMICTWWRKPWWMSTLDVEIQLPPLLRSCACTCGLRVWATGPHVWRHTLHTQPAPPLLCKGSSSVCTT